jgi:hydrogenase 3 maturation protease
MLLNDVPKNLNEIISQSKDKKLLFTGIGNVLRSDDGVGVYICQRIVPSPSIAVLNVEVSIENYIGKINGLNPDLLILIDCMYLGQTPGTYRIMGTNEIADQTFNTHNISLNRLKDFFRMTTLILGIQPRSVQFGENLSPDVRNSAENIIQIINRKHTSNQ